ncbi:hypothetical protein TNCV_1021241 [Trichonephila clavipes]|uniref:Uncharacterized protein n=1 Tax=Trichonephila clavipes TaxID=2585209 RepID=A0A8X6VIT1_TRICX|nr:hypothetical protein TNCV_1021241 [Trichonephila clavipes]
MLIPLWYPTQSSFLDPSPMLCSNLSGQPIDCLFFECSQPIANRTINQFQVFFSQLQMPPKYFPLPRFLATSSQPINRLPLIKAPQYQATFNISNMGWRNAFHSISQRFQRLRRTRTIGSCMTVF